MKKLDLAILFWFYKKPRVCENRLKLLKKFNPDLKIYGLYGGKASEAKKYEKSLGKYLDDFYVCPSRDPDWKWIHGDLMILDWYKKRGKKLRWDSVAVVQWDALVFDSLLNQFRGIKKDQIFLSGWRVLDKKIESTWNWTEPGRPERANYLKFLDYVKDKYNYRGAPYCCLFIFQIFPRLFLNKYLTVKNKKVGMLEYKVPIYAKIFKIPVYKKDLGVLWNDDDKNKALNAIPIELKKSFIKRQLKKKNGWRIFHPYSKIWKD